MKSKEYLAEVMLKKLYLIFFKFAEVKNSWVSYLLTKYKSQEFVGGQVNETFAADVASKQSKSFCHFSTGSIFEYLILVSREISCRHLAEINNLIHWNIKIIIEKF